MGRWSVLVAVLATCCLLPCCAGIVKVANERDGTNDVLFDSAEVLAINQLPNLLKKLTEGGSYGSLDNVELWLESYSRRLENLTNSLALAEWNYETNVSNATAGKLGATEFLKRYNDEYEYLVSRSALASWRYETNITDENAAKAEEIEKEMISWADRKQPDARRFYYFFKRCDTGLAPCKPTNITYALRVIVNTQSSAAPHNKTLRDKMIHLNTELQSIYSKAKLEKDGKEYKLEPEITKLMASSRIYDELLWAWNGWHNVSGRLMRDKYDQFVKLQNLGATNIGLKDAGVHWRMSNYDMDDELEEMVDSLFDQVSPLYRQLHAYVRRKLRQHYPNGNISTTGHIPAHLLGNMWAQQWNDIYDLLVPFPEVTPPDVTANMRAQNYTPIRMFRTAESFYTSIGLSPMTPTFWRESMITRPTDGRDVVCHASAEDFFIGDDYRIKMCTEVNQDDLTTIHHEMGHIQYFMQYRKQDSIFRTGANAAFHEAVGDTIALSVMTPGHLKKINLLNETSSSASSSSSSSSSSSTSTSTSHRRGTEKWDKEEINFLMKMALEKVAFLPFGYLIDKYRWEVFRGNIDNTNYNKKWWEYRRKYQGIDAPGGERGEEYFDPGAKYHVAANVPYIRYFLSFIGQFQFHKALCGAAGVSGKLHECDIYRSKAAGQRLKAALSLGSSQPWPEVMHVLTGARHFDACAIKEYFAPLVRYVYNQVKYRRNPF